jgi:hypothetical protein
MLYLACLPRFCFTGLYRPVNIARIPIKIRLNMADAQSKNPNSPTIHSPVSDSDLRDGPCPNAGIPDRSKAVTNNVIRLPAVRRLLRSALKGLLRFGKFVALPRGPDIEGGQNENAHGQIHDQSTYDHDCEGPLGIRTNGV